MSEMTQDSPIDRVDRNARSLKEALREVREDRAEISDMVVQSRAVELARLEELVEELAPLIAQMDPQDDRFEFSISRGQRPRLWVDMTSFVTIDQDQSSFRFLKDTRMGRILVGQNESVQGAGDIISRYIAEKIIEREHLLEGDWIDAKTRALAEAQLRPSETVAPSTATLNTTGSNPASAQSQPAENLSTPKTANSASVQKGSNAVASNTTSRLGLFWRYILSFVTGIVLTIAAALAAAWAFLPEIFAQLMTMLGVS